MRISEALALRVGDVELEPTGGLVTVYRSHKREAIGSTKSDRFRSVEIGPALARVLADQLARRAARAGGSGPQRPRCSSCRCGSATMAAAAGRARARRRSSTEQPSRASGTSRRSPMPSFATCRCTRCGTRAAAAWLAAGNSLMYVQRQLGHSDIATTERYYGHLERHVLAAGAVATEEAIDEPSLLVSGRARAESTWARDSSSSVRRVRDDWPASDEWLPRAALGASAPAHHRSRPRYRARRTAVDRPARRANRGNLAALRGFVDPATTRPEEPHEVRRLQQVIHGHG